VLTAPSASFAAPIEVLHRFDINDLIAELKSKIMSRSSAGIKQLAKIFKAMDVEDFRWGFIDFGFNLT
jgi:hypothetical protein